MRYTTGRRFADQRGEEILTVREKLRVIYTFFKDMVLSAIAIPWFILEKFGLTDSIPEIFANVMPLFSLCCCGSVLGVTAAISVGLGVGLGVGISCARSSSLPSDIANMTNSTNNTDITGITNTTNITSF